MHAETTSGITSISLDHDEDAENAILTISTPGFRMAGNRYLSEDHTERLSFPVSIWLWIARSLSTPPVSAPSEHDVVSHLEAMLDEFEAKLDEFEKTLNKPREHRPSTESETRARVQRAITALRYGPVKSDTLSTDQVIGILENILLV